MTTKKQPKIKDILTTRSKWCKGKMWRKRKNGEIAGCLVYWINHCYPIQEDHNEVVRKVREAVPSGCHWISEWQDDPKTTFTMVRTLVNKLDI